MHTDTMNDEPQEEHACRICRGEATEDEPLYHPCQCKGSIRYVHEKCLMEWIGAKLGAARGAGLNNDNDDEDGIDNPRNHISLGKELNVKCDICHHPYKFRTIYDENTPDKLGLLMVLSNGVYYVYEKILKSFLMVCFGSLFFVVPLLWGFHARSFTFLLDHKLPYKGDFWKSLIYGYSNTSEDSFWKLYHTNHLFFALQMVFVIVVNLAMYFLYDMVAREKVFLQMLLFRRGPQFTMKELIMRQFKRSLPGLEESALESLADMYVENQQKEAELKEAGEAVNLERAHVEAAGNDENAVYRDLLAAQAEEQIAADQRDAARREAEQAMDNIFLQQQQARNAAAQAPPAAPANEEPLVQDEAPAPPVVIDLGAPQQPPAQEAGPFILDLTLSWETFFKVIVVTFLAFSAYQFISYFIPSFIGFGLMKLYIFLTKIGFNNTLLLSRAMHFEVAVEKMLKYDHVLTPAAIRAYEVITSSVRNIYINYEANTYPNSVWYRAIPSAVTYLTFVLLTCIAAEYMHKGYGPKNGMRNPTKRLVFYVLFSIEYTSKVFLIFVSELAGFPILAGIMIDWSLLSPCLLPQSDNFVVPRATKILSAPISFIVYWCIGTLYMYWFSTYIGMIRQYILRSGVLFFIRSPDDPNTRILHDSLIHPLNIQVSRLCLSMFIYSIIIVCGFGFHTRWFFPNFLPNILPLNPKLDYLNDRFFLGKCFGLAVLFYLAKVIVEMHNSTLRIVVREYWSLCFKMFCSKLRLSSFILGLDSVEERGYIQYRNVWCKYFDSRKAQNSNMELYTQPKTLNMAKAAFAENASVHAYFIPNGSLMRVPASDIVSRNFIKTLFVHVTKEDKLIKKVDFEKAQQKQQKGAFDHLDFQSTEFDEYSIVYTPPNFVMRYRALLIFVWLFSSFLFIGSAVVSNFISKAIFFAFGYPVTYFTSYSSEIFNRDYFTSLSIVHIGFGMMFFASLIQSFYTRRVNNLKAQQQQQQQQEVQAAEEQRQQDGEHIVEFNGVVEHDRNFVGVDQVFRNLIRNSFFFHSLLVVSSVFLNLFQFTWMCAQFLFVYDLTLDKFFGLVVSKEIIELKVTQLVESSMTLRLLVLPVLIFSASFQLHNGFFTPMLNRTWSTMWSHLSTRLMLVLKYAIIPITAMVVVWFCIVMTEKLGNPVSQDVRKMDIFRAYYFAKNPNSFIWDGILQKVFYLTPLVVVLAVYIPVFVSYYKHFRAMADDIVKRKLYARGRTLENMNNDED